MSNREKCIAILDSFSEGQLANIAAMLQMMKQTIEDALIADVPNAVTVAAMREAEEMIQTGTGQHFQGTAADFFAMLDAEDDDDV